MVVLSAAPKSRVSSGRTSQRVISSGFVSLDTSCIRSMDFQTELIFSIAGHKPAIFYTRRTSRARPARPYAISRHKTEIFAGFTASFKAYGIKRIHKIILFCRRSRAKSMRNTRFGWVIFCALAATLGCRALSPDWNGTWKVNPLKSNFQGPIFTISISADGEYRYDDGRSSFTFRCDGKDRPIGNNRTRACVKSSATVLDLTQKENGVKMSANHWELSAGGKVLTSTATAFRSSGPVIAAQVNASRMSGSNDFAGQWRDTSYLQRHADMTLRLDSQTLYIGYPSAGQYIDAPLDGVDAAVDGPHAPEGTTYAVRLAGRREFFSLTKRNGKVLTQGSLKLSNDGRIITDSWWNPDRPNDKGTLVYEKK